MSRGKWIIAFLCVPAALLGAALLRSGHISGRLQAEGVETEAQLAFLKQQGCDYYQGYLYSLPLPAEQFAQLLNQQNQPVTQVHVEQLRESAQIA